VGALGAARAHGRFDDAAVRLGGERAGAAGGAGARGAAYAVQVDVVRLGRFVVEHGGDAFDVQAARGEVRGEEEGDAVVAEGFDAGDTLGGGLSG